MKFEWDEKKQKINFQKHHVNFEDAVSLFDMPYYVT